MALLTRAELKKKYGVGRLKQARDIGTLACDGREYIVYEDKDGRQFEKVAVAGTCGRKVLGWNPLPSKN